MYFEVKNLCFSYYKRPLCIKDVSFSLEKNSRMLVLAKDDEGKSTLLKVLSGFEDTYFGMIKLNGKDIKTIPDNERNFSLLLSEPVLLNSKSIRENIDFLCDAIGKDHLSDEELLSLFSKFKLERELKAKPKKMTLFEKRKLAILRSHIKNPLILFLDDQFTGLSGSEQVEMQEIYNMLFEDKSRVIIMTANNDSYQSNHEFFKTILLHKICYLNLSKGYFFDSIQKFENAYIDRDIFKFLSNFSVLSGEIAKNNDEYFFVDEKNKHRKLANSYISVLEKLGLENGFSERVEVYFSNDILIDEISDKIFNDYIRENKILIYQNLDGSKVI